MSLYALYHNNRLLHSCKITNDTSIFLYIKREKKLKMLSSILTQEIEQIILFIISIGC